MIRFRLSDGAIHSFLPEATEMLERVCSHEVGHAVVAVHFGARVHGIAFAEADGGVEAVAIYATDGNISINDWYTIKAAGSAGEIIVFGSYGPAGARMDLKNVREKGYAGEFDVLVGQATSILRARSASFERLRFVLRKRILDSNDVLSMTTLKLGRVGAYLLDEADFAAENNEGAKP